MSGRPTRIASQRAISAMYGNDSVSSDDEQSYSDSDASGVDIDELHEDQNSETISESRDLGIRRGRGRARGNGIGRGGNGDAAVRGGGRGIFGRGRGNITNDRPTTSDAAGIANALIDKNGHEWSFSPPTTGRQCQANIIRERPGPRRIAIKDSLLQTWQLFLPDDELAKIVRYSQQKADHIGVDVQLTLAGLKALIGFMYYRGACLDQSIRFSDLFSDSTSPIYRTIMSKKLFATWMRVLRFDDLDSRNDRKPFDTFTHFREIWEAWNERLVVFFAPSGFLTVDEQLVSSRCRSPHRVYNPAKPGKIGEMVRWCADSEYRYMYKGNPYTKRPQDPVQAERHKENNKAINLVLDLTSSFIGTGFNVTGDRYFSSMLLAEKLLDNKLTYLGTMTQNRREIPPILHEQRHLHETDFVFGGNRKQVTQLRYQAKEKKKVLMLSTQHHDKRISQNEAENRKPEIILEYNRTKAGVDTFDQMCKSYTTRSKVLRWPVVHFQNVLDVTAINTCTVYKFSRPEWTDSDGKSGRRFMLIQLAKELSRDFVQQRLQNTSGLRSAQVTLMRRFLGIESPTAPILHNMEISGRCIHCIEEKGSQRANKASKHCYKCNQNVCGIHASNVVICKTCLD